MNFKKVSQNGSALVEIIIGSAIILTGILAIASSFNTYLQYAVSNQRNIEANYLMQEGLEAMTVLRDIAWTNNFASLSTTTTYYITWNGTRWATTTTTQYVDGIFLRSISVSDLKRDANDDLSTTTGTYDSNIKQVTVTVSFTQGHSTTTKSLSRYFANIR